LASCLVLATRPVLVCTRLIFRRAVRGHLASATGLTRRCSGQSPASRRLPLNSNVRPQCALPFFCRCFR
jgi:hypothetical protein